MYEYENMDTFYTRKKIKRDHLSHEDILEEMDDDARYQEK